MKKTNSVFENFHYRPEFFARVGLMVIGLGVLIVLPFIFLLQLQDPIAASDQLPQLQTEKQVASSFSLKLKESPPVFPSLNLHKEVAFSFDPPHPLDKSVGKSVLVRLKNGSDSKRVLPPCRVDLEYRAGKLCLASSPSKFWMDLSLNSEEKIEAIVHVDSLENGVIDVGSFLINGEESPFRIPAEFALDSPFRSLSESKWWGRDLLNVGKALERLEISDGEILELKVNDWLVWVDGKWKCSEKPLVSCPVARVVDCSAKSLILEAWDSGGHYRFQLGSSASLPLRTRPDDIFSAIRIRSEKQISCMMEKQCMVLKVGDWVLKSGGKWRILRKKDEHDALLNGKLSGELFVFEQISQNQGQKSIRGRLFNEGRSQAVVIEALAASTRKKVKNQ